MIEFGDLDRDAMTDMIFYSQSSVFTFYNRYDANPASADSLCRGPRDGQFLINNPIFTPVLDAHNDHENVTV